MPGRIFSGENALQTAEKELPALGRRALFVTDPVMCELGNAALVEQALARQGVACVRYSGITGEPTDRMIEKGLQLYRAENCDFLIALGGGSPIDSMKAIGALAANGGKITDYMGTQIEKETPPMAAIPTTAGTGSEATQFTIITDTEHDVKMLLKGRALMPDLAIIDPQFTRTAPPKVTASTGLDALTHAIEAYTSRKAQPLSDTFALSAVRRIFTWLPVAYRDGGNLEAREEMSLAALEAGIAFNNASVTIVHGMSRPIGALFHVPHGLSNAMLLEKCLGFALDGAADRFAALGRAIGTAGAGDSSSIAAERFLEAVKAICAELNTPTVAEYGIDTETFRRAIPKMAHDAMESGSPQNTVKKVTEQDIAVIYRSLL